MFTQTTPFGLNILYLGSYIYIYTGIYIMPLFIQQPLARWKKCKTLPPYTGVGVLQAVSFRRNGTATGFNRGIRGWWRWTDPWWPARAAASRPKTTSSSFMTRESRLNCKWDMYIAGLVDMKRCMDRISSFYPRRPIPPSYLDSGFEFELLLINCTLRCFRPSVTKHLGARRASERGV